MDRIANQILKNLLAAEEPPAEPRKKPSGDQAEGFDHTTRPVLMERAAYLRKMAKFSEGSASETLKEYPRHSIMLSVRLRSGEAELHEHFADLFIVLDGRATLVTGGTVADPRRVGPGETRGSRVTGGIEQELRAGDVAHVAAGTPHQMLLPGDATITSLVIKIQET